MSGAQKIIDGLKSALECVECDHDWEVVEGQTAFRGASGKIVSECPYCGARKTEFIQPQKS